MTQEDKQLLLKDLCARLPYNVKACESHDYPPISIVAFDAGRFLDGDGWEHEVGTFKPYLRPMYSMTEKEREQLYSAIDFYGKIDKDGDIDASHHEFVFSETCMDYIDWLNAHHFDYRGLIKKGLALKAPD